jgi:hypothetical protein
MKHISEYILEVTQLQMRLQDQIIKNHSMLVELGGSPKSISTLASVVKAEDDLFAITVLNAQVNNGVQSVSARA